MYINVIFFQEPEWYEMYVSQNETNLANGAGTGAAMQHVPPPHPPSYEQVGLEAKEEIPITWINNPFLSDLSSSQRREMFGPKK